MAGVQATRVATRPGVDHVGNAASLVEWHDHDGFFLLLFAQGADQPGQRNCAGRGYNRLGLARSRDLMHWEVPPGEV